MARHSLFGSVVAYYSVGCSLDLRRRYSKGNNTSKRPSDQSASISLQLGVFDLNTSFLVFSMLVAAGVEITMMLRPYFQEEFLGSRSKQLLPLPAYSGWMNLFARGLRFSSDMANARSSRKTDLPGIPCAEGDW
jgi:hypothetical protein